MHEQIENELKLMLDKIQGFDKDAAQDGQACHAYLVELTQMMSRANYIMAEYQKKFRQQKRQAYLNLQASSHAQDRFYAPSLAKDYVDAQCSDTGFIFDLASRTSATLVHTADALRTIISSLKSERVFAQYTQ